MTDFLKTIAIEFNLEDYIKENGILFDLSFI